MSLRTLGRKVKMDILQQEGDVCELLFSNTRAQHACRLFLNKLKQKSGLTRTEMSKFAYALNQGSLTEDFGFEYSRTRFYVQIRRTLLTLGLVGIQQRPADSRDLSLSPERSRGARRGGVVDKYVPIRQPITRRPPDGLSLVRLTWIICKKFNDEFFEELT